MYCKHCGTEIAEESVFCPKCGKPIAGDVKKVEQPRVMLDPSENATEYKNTKDSSETFSGQGKTFGQILMIVSVIGDLVAMFAIGFDAFIPLTICATFIFVIGFLMTLFCN